ncbi:unnamed protein product [Parnassius mnemosyne]|uniref:Uncharacterized protein n=1 Tax=Parnassius mnemosyne TaxID=213953 RepID=A0AAV1LDR3_9NEOP
MNIKPVLLALGLLLCKIQAQICGYGDPTIVTSSISGLAPTNCPQLISAPQVLTTPLFGTTTTDNSLSNTLAKVLQLLVVSDLIQSTLKTIVGLCCAPCSNSICEPFISQPIVCKPTIDVITPVTECIQPPCCPVIECIPSCSPTRIIEYVQPPCSPLIEYIPSYTPVAEYIQPPCSPVIEYIQSCSPLIDYTSPCGPVIDWAPQCGPVIDYTPSYGTVFECTPSCGQFIEPLPNFYGGITECISPMNNLPTIPAAVSNCCGGVPEFICPVTNVGPLYTQSFSSNNFGGPIQMPPQVPNCCNYFPDIISPVCNTGLVPTEILLPSAIPAQIICNIESIPISLPQVSMNVEPLPCGFGCNQFTPNSYFYFTE